VSSPPRPAQHLAHLCVLPAATSAPALPQLRRFSRLGRTLCQELHPPLRKHARAGSQAGATHGRLGVSWAVSGGCKGHVINRGGPRKADDANGCTRNGPVAGEGLRDKGGRQRRRLGFGVECVVGALACCDGLWSAVRLAKPWKSLFDLSCALLLHAGLTDLHHPNSHPNAPTVKPTCLCGPYPCSINPSPSFSTNSTNLL